MHGTINMRLKLNAIIRDFRYVPEAEYLVAATIRQYGPVPAVELMQAARLLQNVGGGPQVQMVGVAEYNVGIDVLLQLALMYGLHRTSCAHRHKNGRLNLAVIGFNEAGTGFGAGVRVLKRKVHGG